MRSATNFLDMTLLDGRLGVRGVLAIAMISFLRVF
jgi:hypothetical protein